MSAPDIELKRLLGIDLGSKRIGLAISDPSGTMAYSLGVIHRKGIGDVLGKIKEFIDEREIGEIVLGLPLRMDGKESAGSQKAREFAAILEDAFSIPVHLVDESLSTVQAEEILLEADLSRKKRKKVIDGLAAAVILQSYLNEMAESSAGRKK